MKNNIIIDWIIPIAIILTSLMVLCYMTAKKSIKDKYVPSSTFNVGDKV